MAPLNNEDSPSMETRLPSVPVLALLASLVIALISSVFWAATLARDVTANREAFLEFKRDVESRRADYTAERRAQGVLIEAINERLGRIDERIKFLIEIKTAAGLPGAPPVLVPVPGRDARR